MYSDSLNETEGFCLEGSEMALPGLGQFATATATATESLTAKTASGSPAEDLTKKIRKPYTITKSRESWTEPEHDKFLEALQLFDRDWKKIEAFVGSKTVIQIRSHAQKYFLKAQKSGTGEHLPPPRPKRKATHPYPQKASKTGPVILRPLGTFLSTSDIQEEENVLKPDSSIPTNYIAGRIVVDNCCSSTDSNPTRKSNLEHLELENNQAMRVLPDFAKVYSFIGSVCDPNDTGHVQKLKKMDRIDVDTILLLMRNLSINLTSPEFDHMKLLSLFEIEGDAMERDKIFGGG